MEIWDKIDDNYEISNYGNLRSVDRVIVRNGINVSYIGKPVKWNKPHKKRDFYVGVVLYRTSKTKKRCLSAHREVGIRFIPNPDNKPEINHKDGDKSNNHYLNLEWATRKENMEHAMSTGLNDSRGEKCGNSKLTKNQVLMIRELFAGNFGDYSRLGREYGTSPTSIMDIIKRRTWKHI